MATRKTDVAAPSLGDDILDRLRGLHQQTTVERSHYYVGWCVRDAINDITSLRKHVICRSPHPALGGTAPTRRSRTRSTYL